MPSNEDTSARIGANAAEIAYQAIAPVYDDFTVDHDYELWLRNLLPAIERHRIPGKRLLDVACGTGKSFMPMLERGWSVTACDLAPAMIEIARAKVAAGGARVRFAVSDMRDLPVFGEFDLVWCLDDAINYLLSSEELEQTLRGIRTNMGAGALLVFDLNTMHSFRTFFAEEVVVERNGRRLAWKGLASPEVQPGSIAEASFEVESLEESGGELIPAALHRERHFPEVEVLRALAKAGLETLDIYGHHYDAVLHQPLDEERHTKAVYIARAADLRRDRSRKEQAALRRGASKEGEA